ncbi:hypothetical protein [Pseudomonas putida]|uniref:hypothetical protein n=1 Tax=Pseudomonas putida TaxID=303 RepID=UPI00275DE707|nr:hypothetical protein [Pseudomonas putida]MDP9524537.1 hypothetical protein [Pseudomonas putida]
MEISVDTLMGGYLIGLSSASGGALDGLGASIVLDELISGTPSASVVKRLTEMGRIARENRLAARDAAAD